MLIHVVKPGDSLWKISNYYYVPIEKIIAINELQNMNQLVIGQALVIPTEDFLYTVKSGESLWRIAQIYGITVQEVIKANPNVNPNSIYPGMKLYIPARRHTISPGETLWKIAQDYGVSLEALLQANQISNPAMVSPGTTIVIPRIQKPSIYVNGYVYDFSNQNISTIEKEARHLTYLSPFAYRIREDGSLETIEDDAVIRLAYSVNAVPMMSITNFTSTDLGQNLAHVVLSSVGIQQNLFTNIINIMKTKGYRGINIDFEGVLPADRELYNQLLQRLVTRMHREGFFVSTALAPKVSAEQQGALYTAHDYAAHGRIADFVILMTYEWGYRLGPPQPISPLNEIIRVLNYAVSVIPRKKIYFGFQLYARDWLLPHVPGQEAETFSMQEAVSRAIKYNAEIKYDSLSQTPYYNYTDSQGRQHEVWFEDARSAQAKFDTVKNYNLGGISYWALGFPFPQNWALLRDNFNIRKLI